MENINFYCSGCGRAVSKDEVIDDQTQAMLEICNRCINRDFSQFVLLKIS